jgi:hypothetical protein
MRKATSQKKDGGVEAIAKVLADLPANAQA